MKFTSPRRSHQVFHELKEKGRELTNLGLDIQIDASYATNFMDFLGTRRVRLSVAQIKSERTLAELKMHQVWRSIWSVK